MQAIFYADVNPKFVNFNMTQLKIQTIKQHVFRYEIDWQTISVFPHWALPIFNLHFAKIVRVFYLVPLFFFFFFFFHTRLLPGTRSPAVGPVPCGVFYIVQSELLCNSLFPSGMTELIRLTKLIIVDNLVPMTNLFSLKYTTARSNIALSQISSEAI